MPPRISQGQKRRLYLRAETPLTERIMFYVAVDVASRCWNWLGGIQGGGYAQLSWPGHAGTKAHRASYEAFVGPIPAGMVIDHLCRNRACVNPDHLQPVSQRENLLRSPLTITAIAVAKTHCDHGHEFTPANTYLRPRGTRECRTCRSVQWAAHVRRKAA